MKKALVIFSGGQDSTTCLYWAIHNFDEVQAITFNYGQKHSIELEQSTRICNLWNIKQTLIDISFLDTLVESALTSNGDVNKKNKIGLAGSFVPNRNQLFITLSHAYAQKIGALNLVTGVCQTDYSGYPDCRANFIDLIEVATNTGSGLSNGPEGVKIHTPLMYKTKAETFKFAKDFGCLDEVISYSHTCYNGNRELKHDWGYGCGQCGACEERAKGYKEFLNN
jgi:7-cyano-7-deazaguanine synthase